MVHIIDGKQIAKELRDNIAAEIKTIDTSILKNIPGLATIVVGADPASKVYVNMKKKFAKEVGMYSLQYSLDETATTEELLHVIEVINDNPFIHGILVQLPVPAHIDKIAVLNAIDPKKDVDGFHPINAGMLATGQTDCFVPCTPMGCMMMIKKHREDLTGLNAVVVGRSNIVGKPMVQLLLQEDCTVSSANIHTRNLSALCKTANILVVAAGNPQFIRGDWLSRAPS